MRKIILLTLLVPMGLWAQTITCNIMLFGDKVGERVATRTQLADGTEHYTLHSKLKAKVLWINYENESHAESDYKNGKFVSSTQREVQNGSVKRWCNTKWDGTKLVVDSYKGKKTYNELPGYSIPPIYFKGLQGVARVFYEAEGDFCKVEKTDSDTFEFKSSDGTKNVYHFVNGLLDHMEFHVSIASVKMVRVK